MNLDVLRHSLSQRTGLVELARELQNAKNGVKHSVKVKTQFVQAIPSLLTPEFVARLLAATFPLSNVNTISRSPVLTVLATIEEWAGNNTDNAIAFYRTILESLSCDRLNPENPRAYVRQILHTLITAHTNHDGSRTCWKSLAMLYRAAYRNTIAKQVALGIQVLLEENHHVVNPAHVFGSGKLLGMNAIDWNIPVSAAGFFGLSDVRIGYCDDALMGLDATKNESLHGLCAETERKAVTIERDCARMWHEITYERRYGLMPAGTDVFEVSGILGEYSGHSRCLLREGIQLPCVGIVYFKRWPFGERLIARSLDPEILETAIFMRNLIQEDLALSEELGIDPTINLALLNFWVNTSAYHSIVCGPESASTKHSECSGIKRLDTEPGAVKPVREHRRHLPKGSVASEDCIEKGIKCLGYLPPGYTFVEEYQRLQGVGVETSSQGRATACLQIDPLKLIESV